MRDVRHMLAASPLLLSFIQVCKSVLLPRHQKKVHPYRRRRTSAAVAIAVARRRPPIKKATGRAGDPRRAMPSLRCAAPFCFMLPAFFIAFLFLSFIVTPLR